MKLETERLVLYPIGEQMMIDIIEKESDPEMKKAYSEMLEGVLRAPEEERMWSAVWYMELKDEPGTIVGDFCFKGLGKDGTVEIGYGLHEGFCGRGYMTETVRCVSAWAMSLEYINRVEAETEPDNEASQKVLFRAGYAKTGETGEEGPRFRYEGK